MLARHLIRLLVATTAWVAGCSAPPPPLATSEVRTISETAPITEARLAPFDRVRVTLARHPELSTPADGVQLDDTGALHLPLIGRQELAGLNVAEANAALEAAFGRLLHEPLVTATVIEWSGRNVHVLGHVANPGPKPVTGPMTALAAVSLGGQFLRGADRQHVFLVRPHEDGLEVHEFDVETPDARGLVRVRPGDLVVVRRTGTQDFQEDLNPILGTLGVTTLYGRAGLGD